ncbi:MAG: hypothetical protein GYA47_05375 [Desulfovibrio sp.]|nr:hypothetical protein [Desulfovibrio sp.]
MNKKKSLPEQDDDCLVEMLQWKQRLHNRRQLPALLQVEEKHPTEARLLPKAALFLQHECR